MRWWPPSVSSVHKVLCSYMFEDGTMNSMLLWTQSISFTVSQQQPNARHMGARKGCYWMNTDRKEWMKPLTKKYKHKEYLAGFYCNAEFSKKAAIIKRKIVLCLFRSLPRDGTTLEIMAIKKSPPSIWVPVCSHVSVCICNGSIHQDSHLWVSFWLLYHVFWWSPSWAFTYWNMLFNYK